MQNLQCQYFSDKNEFNLLFKPVGRISSQNCEGQQARLAYTSRGSQTKEILQIIYRDICGPKVTTSLGGDRYFLIFINDYSHMFHIFS